LLSFSFTYSIYQGDTMNNTRFQEFIEPQKNSALLRCFKLTLGIFLNKYKQAISVAVLTMALLMSTLLLPAAPPVMAKNVHSNADDGLVFLPFLTVNDPTATSSTLSVGGENSDEAAEETAQEIAEKSSANDPTIANGPWVASYWNNESLSGPPLVVRNEPLLEHYWFSGESPVAGIPTSNWSARWTRTATFEAHNYRFYASTDDGMRVYVDGVRIIDQWRTQSAQTFTADVVLAAGPHEIWVEYYETGGPGVAKVTWAKAETLPTDSWRGEYYNNTSLDGVPALVRADREIDFEWRGDSPAPGIVNADDFSVRWSRNVYFAAGRYKFETETNDGVRLYVDDILIIEQWRSMPTTKYTEKIRLSEGNHRIRMEYFDDGNAIARLSWAKTNESVNRDVGNIITCVPKNPPAYAWIRIYRRSGDEWVKVTQRGIGSIHPSGFLKIDGLEVDTGTYGGDGHPYRVEQWINNQLTQSSEIRVYAARDNHTPWGCP